MLARMLLGVLGGLLFCLTAAHGELLEIGDEFPDWSMVDQNGASVTSVSYTGRRYVIWFCTEAMTPGCTAEGRAFRDLHSQFAAAGIAVLAVSFDVPQTNGVFASNEGFPFPVLTDSNRQFSARVGAVKGDDQLRPDQITYIVGENGRVVKGYSSVQPLRHAQEVLIEAGVAVAAP